MRLLLLLSVLGVLLAGCQTQTPPAAQAPSETQTAAAPKLIESLTNQTLVHSCPKCGMDFESAGQCTMCNVDLVATKVEYVCPADHLPVESAGKCPRCDADVSVVKTAIAGAASPDSAAAPLGG